MPQLKILISGAGVAGSTLAYWLSKQGHQVTIIERSPLLRTGGLQIGKPRSLALKISLSKHDLQICVMKE